MKSAADLLKYLRSREKKTEVKTVDPNPLLTPLKEPITPIMPQFSLFSGEPDIKSKSHCHYQPPILSIFYGEDNKGEVTWETFKFEVEALLSDGIFTQEQILFGIRRSVKGKAGDIVRRLGTGVTVNEILKKLDSTYGIIENRQTILRKFYSCSQGTDSVNAFASKLEDLYAQAIQLGALKKDDNLLHEALYQGLNPELRHIEQYKSETTMDYDRFKIELRMLEADMKSLDPKVKTCHATQLPQEKKEEKKDMEQLKEMMKVLSDKVDQLQKEKEAGSRCHMRVLARGLTDSIALTTRCLKGSDVLTPLRLTVSGVLLSQAP